MNVFAIILFAASITALVGTIIYHKEGKKFFDRAVEHWRNSQECLNRTEDVFKKAEEAAQRNSELLNRTEIYYQKADELLQKIISSCK